MGLCEGNASKFVAFLVTLCVVVLGGFAVVHFQSEKPGSVKSVGNPHKFADATVKEVKAVAKKPLPGNTTDADGAEETVDKSEKLMRLQVDLDEMIKIMKAWDPKAKVIPFSPAWRHELKGRLNMSRTIRPEWRKNVLDDLVKKAEKIKRRISLPKTQAKRRQV